LPRENGLRPKARADGLVVEELGDESLVYPGLGSVSGAAVEATRAAAPPVDLIDGGRLCELLKEYELGIRRTVRQVEEIHVTPEFFADL
jgi:restriction system protein